MFLISRWVLPIAMIAIGIAILSGLILDAIPTETGLRPILGIVTILLGLHRFVAARMNTGPRDNRRFGGGRRRPWE